MIQTATLAGGCFWCTQAIFSKLKGIKKVTAGYCGGTSKNPTYKQVCTGKTNHTESIQIKFDDTKITFHTILDIFFATHDPTTPNQQGADKGTQYRSAIFYHTPLQEQIAKQKITELTERRKFSSPIITEITPYTNFYPAESYHQNFYENNKNYPYCTQIIAPKIQKLKTEYNTYIKETENNE